MIDHCSYTHNLSSVVCITAMINYVFISFSAVQIYDLSYVHLHCVCRFEGLKTCESSRALTIIGKCISRHLFSCDS